MSDRALVPMLRLDLMSLGNSVRSWVPFLVIVAVVSALAGTELALPMAAAGGFVNATALFAADETYRLRQLYGGLPLPRSTVMVGHYLATALLGTAFVAYGLLIGLLVGTARHTSLIEPLVAAGPTLTVMLVVAAVLIPAYVRFGARKAAMVLLTSMVGGIGLAIFVRDLPGVRPFLEDAAAALAHVQPWMLALSPLVGIAALAASCLVSIRIYQRQDH